MIMVITGVQTMWVNAGGDGSYERGMRAMCFGLAVSWML